MIPERASILLTMTLVAVNPASAQESDPGEALYQAHCMECHDSVVNVRAQARVATLADLDGNVRRWAGQQNLDWDDGKLAQVRDYLNITFYGFFDDDPPPPPGR